MEKERVWVRFGMAAMVCVLAGSLMGPFGKLLSDPEVASLLIYLETGRVVRMELIPPAETIHRDPEPETDPVSTEPTQPEQLQAVFREEDAELVQVFYHWDYSVDVGSMLMSQLDWDLTETGPKVLIVHSHATESYSQTPGDLYEPSAEYRTRDTRHNMIRVGEALKEALEAKGIGVLHDTTLHDYPSYTDSYVRSRETVESYLEAYPSICLVLDLHRDAVERSDGTQMDTQAQVDGKESAQLMLVVGTDAGGRIHPDWEENMALAAKLHAQLEKRFPGLCRPISFRTERFNQDLCHGALLVEVGSAGNTLEEALVAAEALAEAIGDLSLGTAIECSTS